MGLRVDAGFCRCWVNRMLEGFRLQKPCTVYLRFCVSSARHARMVGLRWEDVDRHVGSYESLFWRDHATMSKYFRASAVQKRTLQAKAPTKCVPQDRSGR